ncbi:MAG: hypothetical protein APF76_16555 [Desulfitibacter sp. BRH_c19]|nr:MAG: hypothetical protein APF76_16555 [Desulfitibacter sp. BRH_c19]
MKKIEDERIITEKRRINSNAFGICFLLLWAILLVRQFVLQQTIMEYIDIFLLTIGLSIYITANSVLKGLYLTYRSKNVRKKSNLIGAFVGLSTFTIVQLFVMSYDLTNWQDVLNLIVSGIAFFIAWITIQNILFKISEKKSNKDIE